MADTKTASLTVLGGSLAGARCVLPESGAVTVGSEVGATLRLDLPSVSPSHARILVEAGRVTVYGTGVGREVHVNDNPVGSDGTVLRNGDILWLGSPGEDDVVMLQCVLPRRPAEAPSPATVPAAAPTPEVETVALWAVGPESPGQSLADVAAESVAEATTAASDETMAILPEEATPAGEAPTAVSWEDERLVVAGEAVAPALEDEVVFAAAEAGGPGPVDTGDEIPEEAAAVAAPLPAQAAPEALPEAQAAVDVVPEGVGAPVLADVVEEEFVPEPSPTVMVAEVQEVMEPELPPAPAEPPPAPVVPQPPPVPVVAKPTPEPAPPTRPRPAPPSRPVPRPGAAPRREPRPVAAPVDAAHAPAEAPPARGGARSMWLAAAGLAGVLVIAGLGWVAWLFLAAPSSRSTPPTTLVQASPPPAPASATPMPEEVMTPPPTPETTPLATDSPTPAPTAVPTPTPRATPTPTPAGPAARPTPTPPPVASGPSAEALRQQRAAQAEQLLGQAETALGARQYDAAVSSLDEALRLEPDNDRATSLRADAVRRRDLARKRFLPGRTSVQTEKAQGAALTGFDTGDADLRKAPDFLGRIEFEMSPASGIEPGDAWTLRAYVVNEGRKPIRVQGVTVGTTVNGAAGGGAVPARAREIAPQQRALVAEAAGSWRDGTTAWATEVTVSAGKGDSLKNTITWR